jgi:hypothetical protein
MSLTFAVSLPLRSHELLSGSITTGSLKRGHQGPLLLSEVREVHLVVEISELIRLIIIDLVETSACTAPADCYVAA